MIQPQSQHVCPTALSSTVVPSTFGTHSADCACTGTIPTEPAAMSPASSSFLILMIPTFRSTPNVCPDYFVVGTAFPS
jgi:hypothetical protein